MPGNASMPSPQRVQHASQKNLPPAEELVAFASEDGSRPFSSGKVASRPARAMTTLVDQIESSNVERSIL
jgi:hypothetical protein